MATITLLHDRLYNACEKALKNGKISLYTLDNITHLYTEYHRLGGNGTGTERSDRVRRIQKMLISLGYSCGRYGADGEWGADTRSACIKFQQNHVKELGKPDGLAGVNTQRLLTQLYNAYVNRTEANVRANVKSGYDPWVAQLQNELIRQGYARKSAYTTDGIAGMVTLKACPRLGLRSRGNLTKLVQQRIRDFGYKGALEIDGVNGPHTHEAIKWFQRSKGLSADAIVGRATWTKLLKL